MKKVKVYTSGVGLKTIPTLNEEDELKEYDHTEWAVVNVLPHYEVSEILGFGGAFTEASAYNYSLMNEKQKQNFMQAYFKDAGYNFCRMHIGSCDFTLEYYNYVEDGDETLSTFSTRHDQKYIIPMIKDAMKISGKDLILFASPWSPPAWMKDTGIAFNGGKLLKKYYAVYAEFFVKYIKSYAEEGIMISAVTVQNEAQATQTWESCYFSATDEAEFVAEYLYPAFQKAGLDTKIIIWDHNKENLLSRVEESFTMKGAEEAVWGLGFHWYSGTHFEAVRFAHELFPDKKLIATEFCIDETNEAKVDIEDAKKYATEIMGDLNSGAVATVDWNLLLDEANGPYHNRTRGGCKAPVMFDKVNSNVVYTPIYNAICHISGFVKRGAVVIGTTTFNEMIKALAVKNPNGSIALVVLNKEDKDSPLHIRIGNQMLKTQIGANSMITFEIE